MAKKTAPPKDMSTLFMSSKGTLAHIAEKTNSLTKLAAIVAGICPDLPEDSWHIANVRQNVVVIEVKSAIWSQRLQFERNNICSKLRQETNNQYNQVEIKIAPYRNKVPAKIPTEKVQPQVPAGMTISAQTAQQMLEIAEGAPERLKLKLQSLAALANKGHKHV